MNNISNLNELSNDQLTAINGGWNLIEYIAMGIGYVVGSIEEAAANSPSYAESSILGPNSRCTG